MFCNKCGKEVRTNAKFCVSCGNALAPPESGGNKSKPAANLKVTGIFTKKLFIFSVAACLIIAVCLFIATRDGGNGTITTSSSGSSRASSSDSSSKAASNAKNEVTQTIQQFNDDFENCFDFSVFINDDDLDFDPLEKYFADKDAFFVIESMENSLNTKYAMFNDLDLGSGAASDILGELIGLVPVVGGTLGKITKREIENDPLLDASLWKDMADIDFKPSDMVYDKNSETVTLTLEMNWSIDQTRFKGSNILKFSSILKFIPPDFADEKINSAIDISAVMKRQASEEWVFSVFE